MLSKQAILSLCLVAAAASSAAWPVNAEDAGELHIYNWTDYTAPDLLKKFTKETGIKVTVDTYDSSETLLAKLQAGASGYDLVVPADDFVPILINQKLIQPVDPASMPNYKNLQTRWQKPSWDPKGEYTVPWMFGTTSFAYDADFYKQPVDSFATLFKPPVELQGALGMFGSPKSVINLALIYLGKPLCNGDPATLKQVNDLLQAQKPFVKLYNSDGIADRLVTGETKINQFWSGDTLRARKQKPSIRFVYAKEGGLGWNDNLAVPAGAVNIENAKKFMNFMMDPENAAIQTNFAGYQNAVAGSEKFMRPELTSAPEFNPPADYKIVWAPSCPVSVTKAYDRIWTLLRQ